MQYRLQSTTGRAWLSCSRPVSSHASLYMHCRSEFPAALFLCLCTRLAKRELLAFLARQLLSLAAFTLLLLLPPPLLCKFALSLPLRSLLLPTLTLPFTKAPLF